MSQHIKTTCAYCGVGCGLVARRDEQGLHLEGDTSHPANRGRLCVKGSSLGETLGLEGRLLRPLIRDPGKDEGRLTDWDEALDRIATDWRRIVEQYGSGAVAFYVSGQLLTEDYYVANKFVKGWLGSANIDTNSRLCMASAVAGHKRAFGEDIVPCNYEDLEAAELVVLVGSNTAWCHPVIYQRMLQSRRERRGKRIVVIDPRGTASCQEADLHLPLRAGSDVWLFNGLLHYLHEQGAADRRFVAQCTTGAEAALQTAAQSAASIDVVARACGLPLAQVEKFYAWFANTEKVVTLFSQGVNQSSSGSDKVNSIINCHLLSGRIGKPGMGPLSMTGQPNAMGGREVGGLANTLAAHLELHSAEHRELVQRFWSSPGIAREPGLKAVELFEAIHAGRIKALWIMATNPVVSLPDADRVEQALGKLDSLVVSDLFATTDTSRHAQVVLPALGWGEKDGTVTNSERCISRQRAFLPAPGDARADWWAICEVARRLGFSGFDYRSAHEIFDEHARLSAWKNDEAGIARAFNIAGLAGMSRAQYDALEPCQWPLPTRDEGSARLFGDGRFFHPDRKARLVATEPRPPATAVNEDYPLVLNTGRVRDQWHTMTRSGRAPRLASHSPEPFVHMHPYEAMLAGVTEGSLVRVTTPWGGVVLRLHCSAAQPRRTLFVPIHWNDQCASDARVGALVNPAVDPVSGQPEFKHTPARVAPFPVEWHGVIFSRWPLSFTEDPHTVYWARVQGEGYLRYELAGRGELADPRSWCRRLLSGNGPEERDEQLAWWEFRNSSAGEYRSGALSKGKLAACVYISPRPELPSRSWLDRLFSLEQLSEADRAGLALGRQLEAEGLDAGPTVCACFSVGRNTLLAAIREQDLSTVEAVGAALSAGSNCGSCQPEIRLLLEEAAG